MSKLSEVIPGVRWWPWFSERFGYDFHGFAVLDATAGGPGPIVIDPVEMGEAVEAELAELGVGLIVLTNRNHFRDAARLHQRTHAPVLVHPADADFVVGKGVPVAGPLRAGDTLGPLTVVACPGKSPGEVALHWPARRTLFVGDACVGVLPGVLGLLPAAVIDDPAELRRSLRRLAADLAVDTILCADGHPVLGGGQAALAALVAGFDG